MVYIRAVSINVRGLNNTSKRSKLFHYLRIKKYDVIFLQEVHSVKCNEGFWRSQWSGRIHFSHGESNARGVCVLFSKKFAGKVKYIHKDTEGRFLAIEICIEGLNFVLCNIYAPNSDEPQFFDKIQKCIAEIPIDMKIIAGDFNLVLDIDKDKQGGIPTTNERSQQTVKAMMTW